MYEMAERKMFKTKLCVLFQKGRCNRPNCSFAHGNAELRHSMVTYNDNRDNRGVDLRNKLDRRVSPQRMHSPRRDTGGRRTFRGFSPSTSLEKNSGRKRRKRQELEGKSDLSGSLKILDGAEDQIKRSTHHDYRSVLKLKEMQSNIDVLDHRKSQLKILADEKDEEIRTLTSRIQELEAQLAKEKEDSSRTISKLKKFVKAYKHFVRAQEELESSQIRLQKLGDQLGSISTTTGGDEEDSSMNIVSDSEGHCTISPQNDALNKSPSSKKNLGVQWGTADESTRGKGNAVEAVDRKTADQPMQNGYREKRRKSISVGIPPVDKGRGCALVVPSTSMAADAVDQPAGIEVEENFERVETVLAGNDRKTRTHEARKLPFSVLPPLPVYQDSYSQYKGENEHVDIDGLEEEMVEVDIV